MAPRPWSSPAPRARASWVRRRSRGSSRKPSTRASPTCSCSRRRGRRGRRARGRGAVVQVGVVGAGTMGAGIAQVCATAGLQVVLVDIGIEQLKRGQERIAESLGRLEPKGKLPRPAAEIAGRIRTSTAIGDLAKMDFVIEAAFEDAAVKAELFKKLD